MSPDYVRVLAYDPLWSLAVEWQFYLVWPFILLMLPRKWVFPFLIALVGIAPLLRGMTLLWAHDLGFNVFQIHEAVSYSTLSYVDAFSLGGLLNWSRVAGVFQKPLAFYSSVALFGLGAAAFVWLDLQEGQTDFRTLGYNMISHGQAIWGYTVVALMMTCVLAATFGPRKWILNRVTDSRALQSLGKVSYGIYVYHGTVVMLAADRFPLVFSHAESLSGRMAKVALLIPVAAVTIGWAYASFYGMEAQFLKLKPRRFGVRHTHGFKTGTSPG
jgi:peptidoglycan/LPS O-acetylase OafA/YrhL